MSVPELVLNHQVIRELLTGDKAREGMLLRMVLAGKAMGSTPSAAWVLPVTPEETCGETQGYLKGLLCFEGEDVVNLFLPPDAVEEGVADDSGAGEARVEVESDLVSGLTKQINFKPKTVREKGWRAVNDASGPGEQESWEQSMSLHA